MKNKGYAISAIVYPLLLICLVLILSILQNLNNKQTLLNNLKDKIKNENNDISLSDLTAENISYTNDNVSNVTNVKEALDYLNQKLK